MIGRSRVFGLMFTSIAAAVASFLLVQNALAIPVLPRWNCESTTQNVRVYIDGVVLKEDQRHVYGTARVRISRFELQDITYSSGFVDDVFVIRNENFVLYPSSIDHNLYIQGAVPLGLDKLSYVCAKLFDTGN